MIPTVVWGTGNVGRAAIRAVAAHPMLSLVAVLVSSPAKVGKDAGELSDLGRRLGVAATDDVEAVLSAGPRAVVYAASGDVRPDGAIEDIGRALRAGAVVVTPSVYGMYDCTNAPDEIRDVLAEAARAGGGSLFVSGVDPGWANDVLPLLVSGLGSEIDAVRCQEIFDYSTYDQEEAVRDLIGMGHPLDYQPLMLAEGIPTMIWGGQLRMMARALGVELDGIEETLERRPSKPPSSPARWASSRPAPRERYGSRCRAWWRASPASSSSTSPASTRPVPRTGRRRRTAERVRTA